MEPRWLDAYASMMNRMEAEEALLATQVAVMPNLENRDRRAVIQKWEREAKAGSVSANAQYDRQGREIVDNIDDFTAFLRHYGAA